jgi:hypothetical protein
VRRRRVNVYGRLQGCAEDMTACFQERLEPPTRRVPDCQRPSSASSGWLVKAGMDGPRAEQSAHRTLATLPGLPIAYRLSPVACRLSGCRLADSTHSPSPFTHPPSTRRPGGSRHRRRRSSDLRSPAARLSPATHKGRPAAVTSAPSAASVTSCRQATARRRLAAVPCWTCAPWP